MRDMDTSRGNNSRIKTAISSIFKGTKHQIVESNPVEEDVILDSIPDGSIHLESDLEDEDNERDVLNASPFAHRALPPVPETTVDTEDERRILDYAVSIEKVKDCGWYWGPLSGSSAEKMLLKEPDGSFVVRDSSNDNYIFSLTVKLNGSVRHVRIEQDQGNFSFGCLHKFRSNTIVDFIEDAVEHSRSGRYLFFLHPSSAVMVPMRVQLLHPVSRFKQIQSLQHLCRFVLLKHVRRDLIPCLPLPTKLKSYLNSPHYYSEQNASTT